MTQLNKIIKMVLAEQPGTVMKAGPADPNAITGPFNAQRIAKQIYDAKGYVYDDEKKVMPAITSIKNTGQYTQVNKALLKLTDGRGIGAYLRSFMDINSRMNIASQLMEVLPESQWNWTIKKIVPWNDFRTVAQNNPSIYDKWQAGTTGIGEEKSLLKLMRGPYAKAWNWYSNLSAVEQLDVWWKANGHTVLTTLQIITAFVPIVGWAVSAGIGLVNANEYRKEGDPKTAGIEAIFSLIPGLGLAGKLGLNKIAPKVMANLGKKVAAKQTKNLTKQEMDILSLLGENQKALKTELDNYFRTGIQKSVKQISRDKLAAASKQLGIGATKTTATLASYVTIAQLYGNIYNANIVPLTKSEVATLNQKYLTQIRSGINVMIANLSKKKKKVGESTIVSNKKLNEVGEDLLAGLGLANDVISPLKTIFGGALVGGIALWLKKRAAKRGARIAALEAFNDPKVAQQFGLDAAALAQLWRSKTIPQTDLLIVNETFAKLKAGNITSEESLALIKRLDPYSKVTLKDLQDISPLIAFKSPLVKLTPDQLANLSVNQKIAYNNSVAKGDPLTYKALRSNF